MIVRCYGARGSIAVSGEEYLKYGGDTACLEIRSKNDEIIIVDAGSGIRRLGNKLLEEKRSELHLLFTHSHWDHIQGFPFFKPIYQEDVTIHLQGCTTAQGNLKMLLSRSMSAPFFPISIDYLKCTLNYTDVCPLSFQIDTIEISDINLSHPNVGLGFKFVEDGKSFVFLTDNELGHRHRDGRTFEDYVEFARGADLLLHDAEYTLDEYRMRQTWGHSSYLDALELALAAKVGRFGLFHHNQDRTDTEQDAIVEHCRSIIKSRNSDLECFGVTQTMEAVL